VVLSSDRSSRSVDRPVVAAAGSARHQNGFGLLRLVLASLVIVQHALALTGHSDRTGLGWWRPLGVGELAVAGFFGLSGYLLYSSVDRHSPRRFLRLRFFRLFPGFWGALVFGAFVMAPFVAVATGSWSQYRLFGSGSALSYVLLNATLVILQHGIGGLLAGNPWPTAIDGSLWSLAPEFGCYLTLLVAVVAARRNRRPPWLALLPLVLGAAVLMAGAGQLLGADRGALPALLGSLGLAFFSGSMLAWSGLLDAPDLRRALLIVLATAVTIATGLWVPLGPPLLAASVVSVGVSLTRGWSTRVDARADLSYGVYLYHFMVIQVLVALGVTGLSVPAALLELAPITLALTLVLAAGSWFAVEAPAQRFARRRSASRAPAARQ
jgi:peptidoglycan/LPS O-acetylase OafA/YrhL